MGQQAKTSHYKKRDWPSWQPGEEKVKHLQLVEPSDILLSPLHIKLGITKNSLKATDQTGTAFRYLTEKLPGIRAANIKEGVFIGPQICKLFRDKQFN